MNVDALLGLILGVAIGGTFAWLQLLALRRNELLEQQQQVPRLLRQLPGTGGRVAFLLVALVLVQVLFPTANKWCLSCGLMVAYTIPFVWRLKEKYSRKQ